MFECLDEVIDPDETELTIDDLPLRVVRPAGFLDSFSNVIRHLRENFFRHLHPLSHDDLPDEAC